MGNSPLRRMALVLVAVAALAACSSPYSAKESAALARATVPQAESTMPAVILPPKVTAIGYGALPTQEGLSLEQRRILAIRASKLDAYRSLAETVAGLKLTGNSTVSAVAMNNDSFRVYVEAYLRGARVLTVTPLPGGSYETVLELQLGGDFSREARPALQNQPAMPQVEPAPQASAVASANFYLAQ